MKNVFKILIIAFLFFLSNNIMFSAINEELDSNNSKNLIMYEKTKEKHKNDIIGLPTLTNGQKEIQKKKLIQEYMDVLTRKKKKDTIIDDRSECVNQLFKLGVDIKTLKPILISILDNKDEKDDIKINIIRNLNPMNSDNEIKDELFKVASIKIDE